MARNLYVTPIDAMRRLDASIDQADIGDNYSIPVNSDTMLAHIEGVEAEFERRALSLTDQVAEDELHEGIDREYGWTVYLDEEGIKPIDPNAGDLVEMRSGYDSFIDVTDRVFADTEQGIIEIDQRFVRAGPFYPEQTDFRFRVTYRYGTGGDEAGETTLDVAIADTATTPITTSVADASEMESGEVALVGGSEYFFIESVSEDIDEVTFSQRAIRGTSQESHETGDTLSYIPLNIRDAIAAKVATRFLRQDDFFDALNEGTGDNIDNEQKIEDLEKEFEATVARYTTSSGYV